MAQQEYQPFEMDLNLEEVPSWDGKDRPLLPIGEGYHFRVVNVTNDGKQITIESEVLEGEHTGSHAWNNYNFSNEVGLKRLKNFAVACGAGLGRLNSDDFMGAEYYGDVIHNEGKPKPDSMGNPLPVKTFANIINERRTLGTVEAQPEEEPPPVTRQAKPADKPAETKPAGEKRQTGARRA